MRDLRMRDLRMRDLRIVLKYMIVNFSFHFCDAMAFKRLLQERDVAGI